MSAVDVLDLAVDAGPPRWRCCPACLVEWRSTDPACWSCGTMGTNVEDRPRGLWPDDDPPEATP